MIAAGLVANGARVYISSRKDISELARYLTERGPGECICWGTLDVASEKSIESFTRLLSDAEPTGIDVLVNNAGTNWAEPVEEHSAKGWDKVYDVNTRGVFLMTKHMLPLMGRRRRGRIINIGSIAGKEAYLKGNVYCATKAAVDSFTTGLRMDTNPYGFRVGAIHPGLVETEFSKVRFKGDTQKAEQVYAHIHALQAEDIAQTIVFMIQAPAHVNLADITILPTAQASATVVNRST